MRTPKSYLSSVLRGKANLSEDQLYLAGKFLGLSLEQGEYLQLLLSHERSGLDERRRSLGKAIRSVREQKHQSENYIDLKKAKKSHVTFEFYYLDPFFQIIHMALFIPKFQKNLPVLAQALHLDRDRLGQYILELEHAGIIKNADGTVTPIIEKMHLPKSSPLYPAWRNQLKSLAQYRLQSTGKDNAYSFSAVFSADPKTRALIQTEFLEFLSRIDSLVERSDSQEVYQMNFDLFGWT